MNYLELSLQDPNSIPSPNAGPKYAQDGHLDTVTVVAMLAGQSAEKAKAYAIFSQIPDFKLWTYSSGTPLWAWLQGKGEQAKLLSEFLHAFHGGGPAAVARRRDYLAQAVADLVTADAPAWQVGFLTHAFGDAYAHVRDVGGEITAYGYPEGHAFSPHDPDNIPRYPLRYLTYCSVLVRILGGSDTSPGFRAFHADFSRLFDEFEIQGKSMWARKSEFRHHLKAQSSIRITKDDLREAGNQLVFDEVITFLAEKNAEAQKG